MQKSTFHISKMDCPSEEQMIRLKLADLTHVKSLDFDIPHRKLTVFHTDTIEQISQGLESLHLGSRFLDTVEEETHAINTLQTGRERILLWQVLAINLFFFVLEFATGFFSNSMSLVADSLDMLADAIVYGLALIAVGGTLILKKKIANSAGYLQLGLSFIGFIEIIRRYLGLESVPDFQIMILISLFALMGNGLSLYLLQKSKSQEVHMQASMIFTSNDVIINGGVILAGVLVYFTHSMLPDLLVGAIVFFIVARGALNILKLSK